jgi:hypothetical protein
MRLYYFATIVHIISSIIIIPERQMQNKWNDNDAARFTTLLEQRVYTSRLQGADSSLVLHGGGNTSVKAEV